MQHNKKILFLVTGGTILSETTHPATGAIPTLDVDAYLKKNAFLSKKANIDIERFSNMDSRLMTPDIWLQLAKTLNEKLKQQIYQGIIILHGTDTLEETSFFLSLIAECTIPIILTGAMRSADEYDTDGPRNLQHAIEVILSESDEHKGVMVVFNGHIYAPSYLSKMNTHLPNSFDVDRMGHLGVIENNRVKWFNRLRRFAELSLPAQLAKVDLFFTYPGFDASQLNDAITKGAQGLIIAGYGCGNVHDNLVPELHNIIQKGIPVVMATRVREGSVFPVYGGPGGGVELHKMGVLYHHDLSPFKARILLMLAIANYGNDLMKIQACFQH